MVKHGQQDEKNCGGLVEEDFMMVAPKGSLEGDKGGNSVKAGSCKEQPPQKVCVLGVGEATF